MCNCDSGLGEVGLKGKIGKKSEAVGNSILLFVMKVLEERGKCNIVPVL